MSQDSLRPVHLTAQHSSDVAKVNSHLAAARKRFRFWSTNKREAQTRRDKPAVPVDLDSESDGEDEQRLRDRIVTQLKRRGTPGTDGAKETVERPPILLVDERAHMIDGTTAQDLYQWAVLYENQRGITLFGMAWYSSRGLLPGDPPAFTIPVEHGNAGPKSMSTPHTLRDFQLPDGTWLWVSKSWLVQMAGNGGSHDGFEYNWCFRKKGWRSFPGFLNTGGWVRRRQWVRLMMRPADLPLGDDSTPGSVQNPDDERNPVWQGNAQDDWVRCRQKLRSIGTDRGKIALWRWWLAHSISLADSKKPVKLTAAEE
ncbi:hypothetical protein BS47DRAFT_161713 [Hydnum rufescens UP504]|uniref:TECPR1-like DysF domain-containing protein n=1 Tax=Hydnum rufescens UP504 TaxID=1448309 RepID=A0A9P6AR31_9AGAM|nr:hypothetical protein BS47DRAFT_161713 [Hydnum rufescens UP504]